MIYVACLLSGAFCQGMVSQNHVKRPSPEEWQLSLDPHVLFLQLLGEWYLGLGYFLRRLDHEEFCVIESCS